MISSKIAFIPRGAVSRVALVGASSCTTAAASSCSPMFNFSSSNNSSISSFCSASSSSSFLTLAPVMRNAARTVYSALVQEHFDKPRNVGKFKKSDPNVGTATVGAPECGDMARVQLKVNDETGVIEDTRIQVYGCGSAIASTSYVSEKLKGKTIGEALEITNKDIASELSLPPVKLHCSLLAEEAVRASVANYLQKKPTLKSKVTRKQAESLPHAHEAAPAAEKVAEATN